MLFKLWNIIIVLSGLDILVYFCYTNIKNSKEYKEYLKQKKNLEKTKEVVDCIRR